MTTISLPIPDGPVFSSAIPPLHITIPDGWADVTITLQSDTPRQIYSSRLSAIAGTFDLDIRSIITTWMEARAITTARFLIYAAGPEDKTGSAITIDVIYSRGTVSATASEFAAARFLTLSTLKLLPLQRAFDSLSAWCDQEEEGSVTITLAPSHASSQKINIEIPISSTEGYNRFDLDFQSMIDDIMDTDTDFIGLIPKSAIVTLGDRTFRYLFIPSLPSAAISFANSFNAPEHFWMFGSWSRSGKVTQSKVLVGSTYQSAGAEPEPEFNLVTHGLTFTQSYIIPDITMSRAVWVYLFAQGSPLSRQAFKATPVAPGSSALAAATFKAIPTEGSLEASPHGTDLQEHTIKVIAASLPDALGYQFEIPRIFTDQFTHTFI